VLLLVCSLAFCCPSWLYRLCKSTDKVNCAYADAILTDVTRRNQLPSTLSDRLATALMRDPRRTYAVKMLSNCSVQYMRHNCRLSFPSGLIASRAIGKEMAAWRMGKAP
jgi:hypothetical protein